MLASTPRQETRLLLASNGMLHSQNGDAGKRAREIVLSGIERKIGPLPPAAWSFESFETTDGKVRASALREDGNDIWAVRFSEPDSSTPGREWIVEACCVIAEKPSISIRLSCFSRAGNFSFIPSTPGILKDVVSSMAFFDSGQVFHESVQPLETQEEFENLLKEVTNPLRWWNVMVVSEPSDPNFGVAHERLAAQVRGVANVYWLPIASQFQFEQAFGTSFRVYGGAARTFRSGFERGFANPANHPVIAAPPRTNQWLVDRAEHVLASDAFAASVRRGNFRTAAPGFLDVHQLVTAKAAQRFASERTDPEKVALSEALRAKEEELDIMFELAKQVDEELAEARADVDNLRASNFDLRQRILSLEAGRQAGGNGIAEVALPASYAEIADWVRVAFAGRMSMHKRAERALKDGTFQDFRLVLDALALLAKEYVDLRRGALQKSVFEDKLRSLGLDLSGSISPSGAGEQGEEYFVRHKSNRVFIGSHLKKGTSHDARRSLRIYFFFDEEDQEVVVCWLPGHLDNRLT